MSECVCVGGGGGEGGGVLSSKNRFEIFPRKNILILYIYLNYEKTLKYIEETPKTSPILSWPPKISTKSSYPPNINIFEPPPPPPKKKK